MGWIRASFQCQTASWGNRAHPLSCVFFLLTHPWVPVASFWASARECECDAERSAIQPGFRSADAHPLGERKRLWLGRRRFLRSSILEKVTKRDKRIRCLQSLILYSAQHGQSIAFFGKFNPLNGLPALHAKHRARFQIAEYSTLVRCVYGCCMSQRRASVCVIFI